MAKSFKSRWHYLHFFTFSEPLIEIFRRILMRFRNSGLIVLGAVFFVRSTAFCFAQMLGLRLSPYFIIAVAAALPLLLMKANMPFFFFKYSYWLGCYAFGIIVLFPLCLYVWMAMRGKRG
ncbi:hypothetical protein N0M98_21325 [Paenibacillus doosanensis]|uniref:hypothetical protein n=1 Tax=Paenibacillus doosanensis TaxID=1229154 RepID=UPI00218098B8|nr:hypothetical protein [Paenibacillus doosanensis]MCS7462667.1 hypothetical protein [Paenibacillus doosanensis]